MKKIAIITLNDYFNYGNRLQNYALQEVLNSFSDDITVESIWYRKYNSRINRKYITLKNIRRYIFNRHHYKEYVDSGEIFYPIIREYNIKKFSDRYINTVYYNKSLKDLNDNYDFFIAGSDQIWNYNLTDLKYEFLQFADYNKRIAYAASFGISEINLDKVEIVRKGLEGIAYVSVREQAGTKIINKLTGRDVPILVDPTLLLTAEEWEKVMERPAWYRDEKYILVYFLRKLPDKIKNDIKNLAEKYKLKIVDLMDNENINYYCSPPE